MPAIPEASESRQRSDAPPLPTDASAATPESGAAEVRARLRQSWSPRYRGQLHACITFGFGLAFLIAMLSRVRAPTLAELSVVPLTLLYANLIEWLMHKGPMHHKTRGLGLIHKRHSLEHHRFFTLREMELETARDIKMVLFPPLLIVFFFAFAAPVGLLLARLFSGNVAALFVACALGYFLLYESLHLSYHLPASSPVPRLPILRALRRHHALHHDPARMTSGNFNVTFPLSDFLFRTRLRDDA